MKALGALIGSPRPAARRETEATAPSARNEEARDSAKSTTTASAEFAALLALLAGTGTRVRTELLKQLPAESASLVDRLLDGAGEESSGETDVARDAVLRYRHVEVDGASIVVQPATAPSHDAQGSILARVAESSSPTQLMAMGDEKGAETRAALDRLLDRAGTEAGVLLSTLSDSALPAAAAIAAAGSAGAAPAASIATPVRDAGALVPEFRSRLERVITRMKAEYGHDVALVETTRSQERQDFLYAQGRTRPGAVVTWTQDSAHTRGEAADVLIDGAWSNAEGFARLQRVAREEGLRTLGVRDPGHLELPRDARHAESMLSGAARVSARIENPSPVTVREGTSPVASVAGVAGVAGVARVADMSGAAIPGAGSNAGAGAASLMGAARSAASNTAGGGNAAGNGDRDERARASRDKQSLGSVRTESMEPSPMAAAFGATTGSPGTGGTAATDAARTPAGGAGRATDAQDLRENTPGSLTRLTMSVDGAAGSDERITIDLRGKTVGTHITTDAATADGLRARTGELQDALGRHGLDADTVRISNATRTEAGDANRGSNAERDALKLAGAAAGSGAGTTSDGTQGQGGRERTATAREWEKQEDARRAREDGKEQDARRRGQQRNFNEDPR